MDTDCLGEIGPTARVTAAAEGASMVTYPWDGGVKGVSGTRVTVIKIDSATGSGGADVRQCLGTNWDTRGVRGETLASQEAQRELKGQPEGPKRKLPP